MKTTFTRKEVEQIVLSILMFSNANNNQGLDLVKGKNFGEQANAIIDANFDEEGKAVMIIKAVKNFR